MSLANGIERGLAAIGSPFLSAYKNVGALGEFCLFNIRLIPMLFQRPFRVKEIFYEIERIGVNSG